MPPPNLPAVDIRPEFASKQGAVKVVYYRSQLQMTYEGAAPALSTAIAKAKELGIAQNIAVVDAGASLLAFARMDGARLVAHHSATSEAQTAASLRDPTGHLPPQFRADLAVATGGRSINIIGGLPIVIEGQVIGAVGVSSGSDDENLAVAEAARDELIWRSGQ